MSNLAQNAVCQRRVLLKRWPDYVPGGLSGENDQDDGCFWTLAWDPVTIEARRCH